MCIKVPLARPLGTSLFLCLYWKRLCRDDTTLNCFPDLKQTNKQTNRQTDRQTNMFVLTKNMASHIPRFHPAICTASDECSVAAACDHVEQSLVTHNHLFSSTVGSCFMTVVLV